MKVALVNDTFLEGRGADNVVYELAKRLGKKHETYVLAGQTDIKEENFKFLKINLTKLFTGELKDFNYFNKMIKLRREIRELQKMHHFDIFCIFHSSLNMAFRDFPTVVTWLGSPKTNNIFRKIINKLMLRTLKKSDTTIVISEYLKNQLNFLRNIKVIYCGISKEFKPSKNNQNENYMLYVGRLEKHKDVEEIIKLSKKLNFPLKIVGYGIEENRLKTIKGEVSAPVEFLGKVSKNDLIKLYQNCSFFISASKWEGFGLIFLEAGACSKPSIAYDIGSISEVVLNEKTGFLVNNFSELKEKTEELIKNEKLRKIMGEEALKFSKKFSWNKSVEEYEKIFEDMKNKYSKEDI